MSLTASLLCGIVLGQQSVARNTIRLTVNGEDVTFATTQPYIKNGVTLIPIRGVFEKIGAKVDYDAKTRKVMAYKEGIEILLSIGSTAALVNSHEHFVSVPPEIVSGSTMVPLRFISETLGATVSYDGHSNWINIYVPQHEDDLTQGTPPPTR